MTNREQERHEKQWQDLGKKAAKEPVQFKNKDYTITFILYALACIVIAFIGMMLWPDFLIKNGAVLSLIMSIVLGILAGAVLTGVNWLFDKVRKNDEANFEMISKLIGVVFVIVLVVFLKSCVVDTIDTINEPTQYEKDYYSSRGKTWDEMTPGEKKATTDEIEWYIKEQQRKNK